MDQTDTLEGEERVALCCQPTVDAVDREDAYVLLATLMYLHKMAFEAFDHNGTHKYYQERILTVSREPREVMPPELEESLICILSCDEDAGLDASHYFDDWTRWTHYDKLRLVWKHDKFDSNKITDIIDVIGPNANMFVHALTIQVPPTILKTRELQFEQPWKPVESCPGPELSQSGAASSSRQPELQRNISSSSSVWKELSDESMQMVESMLPHKARRPSCMSAPRKIQYQLHYCGVSGLFDYVEFGSHNLDHLQVSLCLASSRSENLLFATPLGQAKVYNCWDIAFPRFVFQRGMDILFQLALSWSLAPVCHTTHDETPLWPSRPELLLLGFLGTRGILMMVIEFGTILVTAPEVRARFLAAYLNSYVMLCVVIECSAFGYIVCIIRDYWEQVPEAERSGRVQDTVLYDHPMMFAVLIFTKWIQLMLSLLNVEILSETFLPAWHAIKCKSSIVFLSYLFLLTVGSMLSYYALPVGDIYEGAYLKAFFRIFRLTFMGDVDMWQMEGTGQRLTDFHAHGEVDKECHGGFCKHDLTYGKIEPGIKIRDIHNDLRTYECLLALLFPVILLNVYVGLISSAYQDAKDNLIHVQGQFRVMSSFRLLLQRQFWHGYFFGMFSLDHSVGRFLKFLNCVGIRGARGLNLDTNGVWIVVPVHKLQKPLDTQAIGRSLWEEDPRHTPPTPFSLRARKGTGLTV